MCPLELVAGAPYAVLRLATGLADSHDLERWFKSVYFHEIFSDWSLFNPNLEQLGYRGELWASPAWSGAEHQIISNLMHFRLKGKRLVPYKLLFLTLLICHVMVSPTTTKLKICIESQGWSREGLNPLKALRNYLTGKARNNLNYKRTWLLILAAHLSLPT